MYAQTRGAVAYQHTSVQSSSPLELVVLLYDGALRHLVAARDATLRHDLIARRDAFSKVMAIITELQSTLNLEDGGQVAVSLDALYTYMTGKLIESTASKNVAGIEEVEKLLRPLREAWSTIAAEPAAVGARR
ncbi:MAG: flagellar export chaperone FliS [Vicinamibacterales bacterium]